MFLSFLFSATAFVYFFMKTLTEDVAKSEIRSDKPSYRLVIIPEEMNNDYWRLVEEGARKAAEELNISLQYTGPVTANVDDHIKTIQKAVASNVDGIITQGLIEDDFTPLIDQVIQKGIPVITVDTDAPDSRRMSYIGTDNYNAGYLAGQELAKDTNGQGKIAIITGHFNTANQVLRVRGFKDAIEKEKDLEIVAIEESKISLIQAAEMTFKIMNEHSDITAFFGTSALDGVGIASVLNSLDKNKNIYIMAFDTLPETLQLMEEGRINATVIQHPYDMGYNSVKVMVDLIHGEKIEELNFTDTGILRKHELIKNLNEVQVID
ncbi:LacI family transcriptional regulator [Salipaludibacillus neizhouensis]|uniref:LacI family transcriptional regulator n=2 Tax=Salipaludibacillus neizhouensis TaxID=885475 RepID=A0A3A9KKM4_9BACI|nr:LacI family transcriptional regulator [Salipaludibacillus neizhouensis]